MTLLADIAADGQAAWFEEGGLARSITYTPLAGEGLAILALVEYGGNPAETGSPRHLVEEMTARVQAADVALPKSGDRIAVDGLTWTVRQITGGNGFHWVLSCTRGERLKMER